MIFFPLFPADLTPVYCTAVVPATQALLFPADFAHFARSARPLPPEPPGKKAAFVAQVAL
jgi:hypothetical protein